VNRLGSRILSNHSALYDPLSYHYGSVWPLFTGWSAVAAYRYGRPHAGHTALMSNALLRPGALGYVTELISGDYAAFGRSSLAGLVGSDGRGAVLKGSSG
jgi:glycogen debranching enzyme